MKKNEASITSLISAYARVYHAQNEPSPIFSDFAAGKLFTDEEYRNIGDYIAGGVDFFAPELKETGASRDEIISHIVKNDLAPTPVCRAAYCEEALKTAVRTGTEQYVILGAGLDTFAFRNPEFLARHKVYEVDHPLTQADKRKRLSRAGFEESENHIFVPVDLEKGELASALEAAGFDRRKKTFFSLLGVSYYIGKSETADFLRALSSLSSDGSTLLFDYASAGIFLSDVPRVTRMLGMAKAGGEEMRSSYDYFSMEQLLSDAGFLVYELLTPRDIEKRFIQGKVKDMRAFENINYIQAVKKAY